MSWTSEDVAKKMQENKDLAGVNGLTSLPVTSKEITDRPIQARKAMEQTSHETEADFASWLEDMLHLKGYKFAHFRAARVMRHGKEIYETPVSGDAAGLEDYFVWHEVKVVSFWVEIKRESGQLSEKQKLIIASHKRAGITVFVLRPSDREIIMGILESPQAGQAEKV